jgi:hypothetical protein
VKNYGSHFAQGSSDFYILLWSQTLQFLFLWDNLLLQVRSQTVINCCNRMCAGVTRWMQSAGPGFDSFPLYLDKR